jgi:hypothetical protein
MIVENNILAYFVFIVSLGLSYLLLLRQSRADDGAHSPRTGLVFKRIIPHSMTVAGSRRTQEVMGYRRCSHLPMATSIPCTERAVRRPGGTPRPAAAVLGRLVP